jgi:predicted  nucleic acid-binding Zn-ribbon protein
MRKQTKQLRIEELEHEIVELRQTIAALQGESLSNDPPTLQAQVKDLGNSLAQATSTIQTMDGEIGRLTILNDRMFRIIDKMITQEGTVN